MFVSLFALFALFASKYLCISDFNQRQHLT